MILGFLVEWVGILVYLEDCRKSLSLSFSPPSSVSKIRLILFGVHTGVFHLAPVLIRMVHQMFLALSQVALSGILLQHTFLTVSFW